MRILTTLDGSKTSEAVLPIVKVLARGLGAQVTLLEVVEPGSGTTRSGVAEPPVADHPGPATAALGGTPIVKPREPAYAETKDQAIQRVEEEARVYLSGLARDLEAQSIAVDERVLMADDAAGSIVSFASGNKFDLIAMATHGRSGLSELVQGSVATHVMKSGVAPVLLVRPKG